MEYLLVLQLPSSSTDDFDLLIALEDAITESIGDFATVDGHDMGSGEMNIFLFTQDPKLAFERIRVIPSVASYMSKMRVGYRAISENEYTPIYPHGLDHFAVI